MTEPADAGGATPTGSASKLAGIVPRLGLLVGGLAIVLMILLILGELVSTKLFHYSLPYALEYSEYMVPVIAFWGAAYALREGAHVRVDIAVERIPERQRRWIFLAGYILGLVFLVTVFVQVWDVAMRSIAMDRYSFYPTPSPLWPPQLFVAVGLGLFIFQLVVEIILMGAEILGYRR